MKRYFLLVYLLVGICYAQQSKITPIEKAKASVKKYLSLTLNDFRSYQPVEWGKLEPKLTQFSKTGSGLAIIDSIAYYKRFKKFCEEGIKKKRIYASTDYVKDEEYSRYSSGKLLADSLVNLFQSQYDALKSKHVGILDHYILDHKYRAKNGYGAYILTSDSFILDKKLTVTGVYNKAEIERKFNELEKSYEDLKRGN